MNNHEIAAQLARILYQRYGQRDSNALHIPTPEQVREVLLDAVDEVLPE